MHYVKEYYSALNIVSDSFKLTNKEEVFKISSNLDPEKACGLDEILCRMLKDGPKILAEALSQIVNILGSKFSVGCKRTRVKPIFKKGKIQKEHYINVVISLNFLE